MNHCPVTLIGAQFSIPSFPKNCSPFPSWTNLPWSHSFLFIWSHCAHSVLFCIHRYRFFFSIWEALTNALTMCTAEIEHTTCSRLMPAYSRTCQSATMHSSSSYTTIDLQNLDEKKNRRACNRNTTTLHVCVFRFSMFAALLCMPLRMRKGGKTSPLTKRTQHTHTHTHRCMGLLHLVFLGRTTRGTARRWMYRIISLDIIYIPSTVINYYL